MIFCYKLVKTISNVISITNAEKSNANAKVPNVLTQIRAVNAKVST